MELCPNGLRALGAALIIGLGFISGASAQSGNPIRIGMSLALTGAGASPSKGCGRHDCHRLCCNVKDDAHRVKHLMPIVARFRIGGMLDIIRLHALLSD